MKKSKNDLLKFEILNVKVAPKSDEIDSKQFYLDAFERINSENLSIRIKGEKYIEFKSMKSFSDGKVLYGQLVHFTKLSEADWYNQSLKAQQTVEVPADVHPNSKLGDFYFIPEAHRFCVVIKAQSISTANVKIFLQRALEHIMGIEKQVYVIQEVTEDVIERIFHAEIVSRLEIQLSYSNNDLSSEFQALIDQDMKDTKVRDIEFIAKSFKSESLNLADSKILSSALKLSQSNGSATATIKNGNDKAEKINTSEYPRRETVSIIMGEEVPSVYDRIMKIFRHDKTSG